MAPPRSQAAPRRQRLAPKVRAPPRRPVTCRRVMSSSDLPRPALGRKGIIAPPQRFHRLGSGPDPGTLIQPLGQLVAQLRQQQGQAAQ